MTRDLLREVEENKENFPHPVPHAHNVQHPVPHVQNAYPTNMAPPTPIHHSIPNPHGEYEASFTLPMLSKVYSMSLIRDATKGPK